MALIMAILGFIVGGAVLYFWGLTKQRNDAVNLEAARAQAEEITKAAQTKSRLPSPHFAAESAFGRSFTEFPAQILVYLTQAILQVLAVKVPETLAL